MKLLVACEESQAVCSAFRARGHEAYSCDIIEPSGGHPEWHIKQDVLPLLDGRCEFDTLDGAHHVMPDRWDMIIAHPPCTYLAVLGNRWFDTGKYGKSAWKRMSDRNRAIAFFYRFVMADCDRVVIENPIGVMSTAYRKPDQIIEPYMFGDHARKSTCLWEKGVNRLIPSNIVDPGEIISGGYSLGAHAYYARDFDGKILSWNHPMTARIRSKTFPGIAAAMAEQWG